MCVCVCARARVSILCMLILFMHVLSECVPVCHIPVYACVFMAVCMLTCVHVFVLRKGRFTC